MPEIGAMNSPQTIAHYKITAKLGEGGMGEVWRATDTELNREVAIKILPEAFAADPDRMVRFTREAQVLASLNHPNIAAIYGVEERALVLELVEGPTLAERIRQGPIPLDEALPIARQIAEALEYAHERGIIHRDLKPANIKVTTDGRVKVLDFGLAKAVSGESARAVDPASSPTLTMRATLAGVILGTAGYMSPEQARGHGVDKRADIWSFGVILLEMVTGRAPFTGATISDTLAAVLRQEVNWSAVPERIEKLLRLCLTREPRERLREISDARFLIEDPRSEGTPGRAGRARALPWAVAAVLALVLTALSAIHFRETPPERATVRFQIFPPEGGSFGSTMALSPDGRKLAFVVINNGGQSQLWVRGLDTVETRPLRGTESAVCPFWSLDGRFLAFDGGSKLEKIDFSGGPPQVLCNLANRLTGGGYWSRDGNIWFATPTGGRGILRVSQAGGDPVLVPGTDAPSAAVPRYPQVLPDLRRYLYLHPSDGQDKPAIYLGSLDSKESQRLVASTSSFGYVPPVESGKPGHLLFLREQTLMAQPLAAKTFRLAGDAFPIAEGVGRTRTGALFSVSENGVLAYRSGAGDENQLSWFDRAGKPLGTMGAPGSYNNLAISRDGTRAAAQALDLQTGNRDLWLIDMARRVPTRFTFDEVEAWNPVWSPDGSRVAYSSVRDGPYTLYLKDSSGVAREERLQKTAYGEAPCDWSPDGRFLMYTRRNPKTGLQSLWTLAGPAGDPASRKAAPYLESPFDTSHCQFSPDSRWVAYTSDESKHSNEIYVQSFPAGAGKFQVSTGGGNQPRWRRDGKELFYLANDGKLMAVDVKTGPRFESGIPRALFDPHISGPASQIVFRYDVAPDGQRFLVITPWRPKENAAAEAITVVVNWTAGLKK